MSTDPQTGQATSVGMLVGSSNLPVPSTQAGMNTSETYLALKNPSPIRLNKTTPTALPSTPGPVVISNPLGNGIVLVGGLAGVNDQPYWLPGQIGVGRGTRIPPGKTVTVQVTSGSALSAISQRNGDIIEVQSLLSGADSITTTSDPDASPLSVSPFHVVDTFPVEGATQWPLNGIITILMDRPPDPMTVSTDTVEISPSVTGLRVYLDPTNNKQITVDPSGLNFAMNTVYTITIPTTLPALMDQTGGTLYSQYQLSFTTFTPATPTVSSVTPGSNTTNVAINSSVVIVMNIEIKPADINGTNIKLIRDADASTVSCSAPVLGPDSKTITLTPSSALLYSNVYYVTVSGLHNVANIIQVPNPWNGKTEGLGNIGLFTTTAVGAPPTPTVSSVTPGSNSTGISVNTTVVVIMNTAINPANVTNSNVLLIKDSDKSTVTTTCAIAGDNMTITITPSAPLAAANAYFAQIQNQVNTNLVAQASVWYGDVRQGSAGYFTTAAAIPVPTVASSNPGNNATGVSKSTTIAITMNTAIQPVNATSGNIQLIKQADSSVVSMTGAPVLSGGNTIATITPSSQLAGNTVYYIKVQNQTNTNAVVQSPNPFYGDNRGGNIGIFTTVALAAPTISSVSPGSNATNVAITTTVAINLSIAITPANATGANVQLIKQSDLSVVACGAPVLSNGNQTITLTPSSSLLNNTVYYVMIQNQTNTDGVVQSTNPYYGDGRNANAGLFTTIPVPAPTVSTCTPGSNATSVAVNTTETVVMNEAIQSANVNTNNIGLIAPSGLAVPSTVALNPGDNKTITITPSSNLDYSTAYYVVVQNQYSFAGSPATLQSPNPWYGDSRQSNAGLFTTVVPTPNVSSVTPGSNATGVAINTTVSIVMNTPVKVAGVISTNVYLVQQSNGQTIPSSVALGGDGKTITLTPTSALGYNTAYYVIVQNLQNTVNVTQSPNPWNPYGGTESPVYNVAQDSNTNNQGCSFPMGAGYTCGATSQGPPSYGQVANASNGLIGQIVKKVVVKLKTLTTGTGTATIKVIKANGTIQYTFAQTQSVSSTGGTVYTFVDTNNTYALQTGDGIFVVWDQGNTNTLGIADSAASGFSTHGLAVWSGSGSPSTADSRVTGLDMAAQLYSSTGGGATDNVFTTAAATYTQRYNVSQSANPCNSHAVGYGPPATGINAFNCGPGNGTLGTQQYCIGTAYGETASVANGLTAAPITKVVIAAVAADVADTGYNGQGFGAHNAPTGTIGVKIINSSKQVKYTFTSTYACSATDWNALCNNVSWSCSYSTSFKGYTNITLVDNSNNYTMVVGDILLITWTGTGNNVIAIGHNASGPYGKAVYQDSGGNIQTVTGMDVAFTAYSTP